MSATAAGCNQQKAVVNWLSNNSVSIVQVDAIPTEARQEHAITQVQWGSSKPVARIVKISRKFHMPEPFRYQLWAVQCIVYLTFQFVSLCSFELVDVTVSACRPCLKGPQFAIHAKCEYCYQPSLHSCTSSCSS